MAKIGSMSKVSFGGSLVVVLILSMELQNTSRGNLFILCEDVCLMYCTEFLYVIFQVGEYDD